MVSLKNKSKGFTIVELLIVIVVIGILATLVLVTFNGIQQKGRDSKRKTDLGTIEQTLDAYYTDSNSYPTLAQLNDSTFQTGNLKGFNTDALKDPKSSNAVTGGLAVAGTVDGYHYKVTPADCANTDANPCVNFEISTGLEGDAQNIFSKQSSN